METTATGVRRAPWNKGKLVGQKAPLKVKDIWAIRVRLQIQVRTRDLALFDLGIDSKLRGCHLVKLRVRDVCHGERVASRPIVLQQKTQRPVQFEITPPTREAVEAWIKSAALRADDYLFRVDCIRRRTSAEGSTLAFWTAGSRRSDLIRRGTERIRFGVPSQLIYRRTRNLRAVQLLLGHTKLESTVRYLGIEVDDALEIAEQTEV